jgi:hypothetical protein
MSLQLEMSPEACGVFCFMLGLIVGFMLGMIMKIVEE